MLYSSIANGGLVWRTTIYRQARILTVIDLIIVETDSQQDMWTHSLLYCAKYTSKLGWQEWSKTASENIDKVMVIPMPNQLHA